MKARTIAKLRKKIKSDGYIESRMTMYAERCKYWNDFFHYDCDTFIAGEEMKYVNTLRYNKYGKRCKRKFDWYKRKFEKQ